MRIKKRGQSAIEYTILLVILMGVFLAMSSYVKRGFQGRWRATMDEFGDQYDPNAMITDILYTLDQNVETRIMAEKVPGGVITNRVDIINSVERKVGPSKVGAATPP